MCPPPNYRLRNSLIIHESKYEENREERVENRRNLSSILPRKIILVRLRSTFKRS